MSVSIEQMTITPELAKHWLDSSNTHNRNLRQNLVAAYARDMTSGNWRLTGDTIKLAADGTLIDGQHRLAAVVKSMTDQPMFVASGIDLMAQEMVDTGAKRTFGDVLGLRSEGQANALAAVTRMALVWEKGQRRSLRSRPVTHAELSDMLERHPELRNSVHYATRKGWPVRGSLIGFCHWLFSGAGDPVRSDEFFDALHTGANLDVGSPILAVKNALSANSNRSRLTDDAIIAFLIKAWNAWRRGKTLKFVTWNPDREAYPTVAARW